MPRRSTRGKPTCRKRFCFKIGGGEYGILRCAYASFIMPAAVFRRVFTPAPNDGSAFTERIWAVAELLLEMETNKVR